MTTESEALDTRKENEERRTRGGQAGEDRAKSLETEPSDSGFDGSTEPEEKE